MSSRARLDVEYMRRETRKRRTAKALAAFFAAILVFLIFIPIYWLVLTSFKTLKEVISIPPTFWTTTIEVDNFILPFLNLGFDRWLINSSIIAVGSVALNLPLGFLAAYTFSRYKFLADNHLFFWTLTNRMAPPAVFIIPYYMIFTSIGLYDTQVGLIVVYTVFNLPLAIWLMKGFIDGIPTDLDEAGLLDGHSSWHVVWRIIFPLCKPGLAATSLMVFTFSWNEFLFAMILTAGRATTLPASLSGFITTAGTYWGELAAVSLVAMIPGLILAAFVARYLVTGLTLGLVR